jgi:hypothetical protein
MMRSLCVCFVAATLSVTACGGSSSKTTTTADTGAGGSAGDGSGGGGGTMAGAGGAGGAPGGGGSSADLPVTDATYDVGEVPAMVVLDAAPMTVGEIVCEKVFACCTAAERAGSQFLGSQQGCAVSVGVLLGSLLSAPETSIQKGRVVYDATALAGCLRAYMMQTCDQARTSGGLTAFRNCKFVTPKVAVGGACQQHYECVNGWCSGVSGATEGTCVAKVASGQPCASGLPDECVTDYCSAAKVCGPAPAAGLCTSF